MKTESHIDYREVDEQIADAARHIKSNLPASVREDISRCRSDLYFGPLYFDALGEECSCFDEGAHALDFQSACRRIDAALDDVEDLTVEVAYDDETGESDYEPIEDSARSIRRLILGRELASTIGV